MLAPDGRVTGANERMRALFAAGEHGLEGISAAEPFTAEDGVHAREELVRSRPPIQDLAPEVQEVLGDFQAVEDDRPALEARLREALRSTSGVERDLVIRRRDGRSLPVITSMAPLRDADRITAWVATVKTSASAAPGADAPRASRPLRRTNGGRRSPRWWATWRRSPRGRRGRWSPSRRACSPSPSGMPSTWPGWSRDAGRRRPAPDRAAAGGPRRPGGRVRRGLAPEREGRRADADPGRAGAGHGAGRPPAPVPGDRQPGRERDQVQARGRSRRGSDPRGGRPGPDRGWPPPGSA